MEDQPITNEIPTETVDAIIVLKTITNDELIATVSNFELAPQQGFFKLSNVFGLGINNEGRLLFVPFMPYTLAQKELSLPTNVVQFVTVPIDEVRENYIKITNPQKIIAPSRGIITPIR